jgi:hypothetical protein
MTLNPIYLGFTRWIHQKEKEEIVYFEGCDASFAMIIMQRHAVASYCYHRIMGQHQMARTFDAQGGREDMASGHLSGFEHLMRVSSGSHLP